MGHILKHIGEDFRSIFVDSYKDGVNQATPHKVIYIDPNKLKDPDMAKNVARLREDLEKQLPGITGKPGSPDYVTDADLQNLVTASTTGGPFAIKAEYNGQTLGIINRQDKSLDHRDEIVPLLTGVPLEKLKRIPGDDYIWDKMIGIHEGTHVNQAETDPSKTPAEIGLQTLQKETEADQAALAYARSMGREDIVAAWKDYRAIGAAEDPAHATALFLDSGKTITPAYYDGATKFKGEMDEAVAQELKISKSDAAQLLKDDPEKYIDIIDKKLKEGSIGSTPETKEFMEQFAGAYRRQVIDKKFERPLENEFGPRASVELPDGVRWTEYNPPTQQPVMVASNTAAEAQNIQLAAFAQPPMPVDQGYGSQVSLSELDETTTPSQVYGLQGSDIEIRQMLQDYGQSIGQNLGGVAVMNGPNVENLAGFDFNAQPVGVTGPQMKAPGAG